MSNDIKKNILDIALYIQNAGDATSGFDAPYLKTNHIDGSVYYDGNGAYQAPEGWYDSPPNPSF